VDTGRCCCRRSSSLREKRIEQIEVNAEKEPEKTKFAWDLARVKLEAYFDRNLSQVRTIFFVAVLVMIVGFGFIMWGVGHGVSNPDSIKTSYLAAISGIITEFIGVTFIVIYRSTMAQANQFMEVLERINTVGMAVQILDAIPEQETQLKNSTRAEIVSLLLSVNARGKSTPKTREQKIRPPGPDSPYPPRTPVAIACVDSSASLPAESLYALNVAVEVRAYHWLVFRVHLLHASITDGRGAVSFLSALLHI